MKQKEMKEIKNFKDYLQVAKKATEELCRELKYILEPALPDIEAFPDWDRETGEFRISLYSESHFIETPTGETLEKVISNIIPNLNARINWPDRVGLRKEEVPEVKRSLRLLDLKLAKQFDIAVSRFEEAARILCEHLAELLQPIIPDIKCQGWRDKIEFYSESHLPAEEISSLNWEKSLEGVLVKIMPELQRHIAFPPSVFLGDEEVSQVERLLVMQ